ncbi:MAG TPA: NADPH-dependent 7-cyano-7-deazaguanine reductase QueF [Legionella sp.]|nr:NADPH-dependent 7-cyano-7-deazaguanine reductase QueF [Legionella sp.]
MSFESDNKLELGKKSAYESQYNPELLFPISRLAKRAEIGINADNPGFLGFDLWNHYEVSWLNPRGKPIVATAQIVYDCQSPCIIESKSLKLYFNSLNNTSFSSFDEVEQIIARDLSQAIENEVSVSLKPLHLEPLLQLNASFAGECIDDIDVDCSIYEVNPQLLTVTDEVVEETLYSDLLKSNCLVTYQPDWGSVQIHYRGFKISRSALLQYIVSFRNHNEFHEQCIERIFADIMRICKPVALSVYGRYTRRGGLDINPYRATPNINFQLEHIRLIRQ